MTLRAAMLARHRGMPGYVEGDSSGPVGGRERGWQQAEYTGISAVDHLALPGRDHTSLRGPAVVGELTQIDAPDTRRRFKINSAGIASFAMLGISYDLRAALLRTGDPW